MKNLFISALLLFISACASTGPESYCDLVDQVHDQNQNLEQDRTPQNKEDEPITL